MFQHRLVVLVRRWLFWRVLQSCELSRIRRNPSQGETCNERSIEFLFSVDRSDYSFYGSLEPGLMFDRRLLCMGDENHQDLQNQVCPWIHETLGAHTSFHLFLCSALRARLLCLLAC